MKCLGEQRISRGSKGLVTMERCAKRDMLFAFTKFSGSPCCPECHVDGLEKVTW